MLSLCVRSSRPCGAGQAAGEVVVDSECECKSMMTSFQHYAKNSPDALASFDASGHLAFANERFVKLFPRGPSRLDGCKLDDLPFSPSLRSALVQGMASARGSDREERFTCEERSDASLRIFLCRIIPLPGPEGGQTVLVELRDETASLELREALLSGRLSKRQEELLRGRRQRLFLGILDEFPAFVYMQRRNYTVAYANRKVRNLYGDTESRLCYEVFTGRKKPCPVCPTFEVFETGRQVEWEFVDHKGRTFRIYDYPYEDESGEPLVMELGIDITDLKRVESELFQAQKLRAIGVLAGGIAHDLNNNLVPIIFNIDHTLHQTADAKIREPLAEALQAAYRAAGLVEQVLQYSRQQNVSRTLLPLTPLLHESLEVFRKTLPATFALDIELETGHDSVLANPAQVQQIIMNLLHNAQQAMPNGGTISFALGQAAIPTRESAPHPELAPGTCVTLRVQDTGVGIKEGDVERIFEPFFTTKKARGGTGMGLAVVHSIVTCCGGAITVDTTPGVGTAFTVYLPQAPTPAAPFPGEPQIVTAARGRILLVDDDPRVLSAMARTLGEAGFDVDTARNGEEGIAAFARAPHHYRLVLADQSMPGMSGMQMAAQLLAFRQDTCIVICTGNVEPELEKQARAAGIAGFAVKPMTPQTLVEMVQQHNRRKRFGSPLEMPRAMIREGTSTQGGAFPSREKVQPWQRYS